jgi:hypothetical protein
MISHLIDSVEKMLQIHSKGKKSFSFLGANNQFDVERWGIDFFTAHLALPPPKSLMDVLKTSSGG